VEPDYLPELEVFYLRPCLYPMKYLNPRSMYTLPRWGVQRGGTPSAGFVGSVPRSKNCLVKVYCNFIVNQDRSL
jgi:hypothetical protein